MDGDEGGVQDARAGQCRWLHGARGGRERQLPHSPANGPAGTQGMLVRNMGTFFVEPSALASVKCRTSNPAY